MKTKKINVRECAENLKVNLKSLRKRERPAKGDTGSKADVLHILRREITALAAQGYTPEQIAGACSTDDFQTSPEAIKRLLRKPKSAVKPAVKRAVKRAENAS